MQINSNFLNGNPLLRHKTYTLTGQCPIARRSFETLSEAHQKQKIPYVVGFAMNDLDQPLVPLDGIAWYQRHAFRPKSFFENSTNQKIHFLALVTLENEEHYTSYLGTLTKDTDDVNNYLRRYILATSSCTSAPSYAEQLLAHHSDELDMNELVQFGKATLARQPDNKMVRDALINRIIKASNDDEACERAAMIAAIAEQLSVSKLYECVVETLADRGETRQINSCIHTILKKWLEQEPNNTLALTFSGIMLMPHPAHCIPAARYFVKARNIDPKLPIPYYGLAALIFQNKRSASGDIELAKQDLIEFLTLGLSKHYPESIRDRCAEKACDLIRKYRHRFRPDELELLAQKILVALPAYAPALELLVDGE